MRKLMVFNQVSLDGYFVDGQGDMSWAKSTPEPEFDAFVQQNASGEAELVFGRVTHDLMVSYWPTPMALQNDPVIANRMNALPKVVFSRTLTESPWNNTRMINADPVATLRKMKEQPGPDLVIFGSGTLVSALSAAGLIDEFQLVIIPIALGSGRSMFDGIPQRLEFRLTGSRAFRNGSVVLNYAPVGGVPPQRGREQRRPERDQ
jgi:dihydrofolate reductase